MYAGVSQLAEERALEARSWGFESLRQHQRDGVAKWLKQGSAKPLFDGSIPSAVSNFLFIGELWMNMRG